MKLLKSKSLISIKLEAKPSIFCPVIFEIYLANSVDSIKLIFTEGFVFSVYQS